MYDTKYFLTRLQNGEDLDKIGKEIADMMNEANAAFEAEKAKEAEAAALAEKEEAKKGLIEELIEIIQELAILEGMDPEDIKVTDEEVEDICKAFTDMFKTMRDLKKMFAAAAPAKPVIKAKKVDRSDDQILADFLSIFN